MNPPESFPTLTVVMPAYNEEAAIEGAVTEVVREILDRFPGADCLVIDDGGTDDTGEILHRLSGSERRVLVIHQKNAGHGAALRAGMERAAGDWLLLVDSDRQIPIETFASLWEAAQGRDAAFGVRVRRQDPLIRRLISVAIRVTIRALFGVSLRDANAPFKLMRRPVWESARSVIPESTLAPSLFLAIFARVRGLDVAEVEVPHRRRQAGVGSLHARKLFRFCFRGFGQLLSFRGRLRRCR